MARNFGDIAFTEAVKKLQEKFGSRSNYERMQRHAQTNILTPAEIEFIGNRDSFYMASLSESGFPYIQHRGGLLGFLHVVDNQTMAFADYSGNKQYISVGNIATNNKVSLIMVDYAAQARLKIFATAELLELKDHPQLAALLKDSKYSAKMERIIQLKVQAYDWNCPQHITQRFTLPEIESAFQEQRDHILKLEKEIERLKQTG